MKSNFIIKSTCTIAVLAFFSCQNETNEMYLSESASNSLSLEQLEKIAYGCDSYVYDIDSDEKVETSASDEYMALIEERMTQLRANKGVADYSDCAYVGVIKADKEYGCGKFDEIEIRYDCEDGHNNDTHYSGFKGLWDVEQNITMRFCLVHNDCFRNTKSSYGVINFYKNDKNPNWKPYADVTQLKVHMDAEDHHEETFMKYIDNKENKIVNTKDFGTVHIDKNGNLDFELIVYLGNGSGYNKFPSLGIQYGVFGSVYNDFEKNYNDYYGHIHSDDEDNNNANSISIKGGKSIKNMTPSYEGVIHMGRNTDFYLTRVM